MASLTSTDPGVTTGLTPVPAEADRTGHVRPGPRQRGRIGWILAGSLAAGIAAAVLLVAAPLAPAEDSAMTGVVLCGFGVGWAILAVLSMQLTDQPQRWAAAPALLMGMGGLLLLTVPSVDPVLGWVWPPAALTAAIWMAVRAHRQLQSRSRRWLLYPVVAMLALAAIGGGYETVQEAADARAYPAPGQLIDVGGHRLHLNCTGSRTPTVLLEPGAGGMSSTLGWITPAIAADTRVCVYDRAGRGWSEPAGTPQDASQIALDLHELLQRAHVPGPYVLAGHSFGGLYVLTFAARYPNEVAGMVLVDSTAPASRPEPLSTSDEGSVKLMDRVSALVSASGRLGIGRIFSQLAADGLPRQFGGEVKARSADANSIRSTIDEYREGGASAREAASLTDFAAKPLIVLTAGSGHDATWTAAQNHLATLSTNSAHHVIAGATHDALVSEEKPSAATARAVLDVVSAVRYGLPVR